MYDINIKFFIVCFELIMSKKHLIDFYATNIIYQKAIFTFS